MVRTILLVEDDEPTLALMATALTRQGHEVLKARDTIEAERLWTEPGRLFDLLIADVRLSEEDDGFALARKLLELQPGVPVIFVSGDRDCFACPAVNYFGDAPFISKPFDLNQMIKAVNDVLAKSPKPQA